MIFGILIKRFYLWLLSTLPDGKSRIYKGITLCDLNSNDLDDEDFFRETEQALQLIEDVDPRRFRRVKNHINYIVNTELASIASYNPGKICKVDFGRYDFETHPDWSRYMYAAILVHEATHGEIGEKGIEYKRNRLRIEKICRAEENRFLAKIDSVWGDDLRVAFNPSDWDPISKIDRIKIKLHRVRESKKRAHESSHSSPDRDESK